MAKTVSCPICGNTEASMESYQEDPWCILEETLSCNLCGFYSEYLHGYTRAGIKGHLDEWDWSYRSTYLEIEQKMGEIKELHEARGGASGS
jgi:hypothetical protein